jgi:hypothetical protein
MVLIGSCGCVGHKITLPMKVSPIDRLHYFDITKIERYNVIVGTLFMYQTGATLDFARWELVVNSHRLPSQATVQPAVPWPRMVMPVVTDSVVAAPPGLPQNSSY